MTQWPEILVLNVMVNGSTLSSTWTEYYLHLLYAQMQYYIYTLAHEIYINKMYSLHA